MAIRPTLQWWLNTDHNVVQFCVNSGFVARQYDVAINAVISQRTDKREITRTVTLVDTEYYWIKHGLNKYT